MYSLPRSLFDKLPDAPWNVAFDQRLAQLKRGMPRVAYYYATPDTSTFRYRAYNIAQVLDEGVARRDPSASWFTRDDFERIGRVIEACDILVLCRNSLYDDRVARIAAQARAYGRTLLFDVDDLVFDPAYVHTIVDTLDQDVENPAVWNYWFGYVGRVGATFALCDGALVTTDELARRATSWSGKPARVIPNFYNREQERVSDAVWNSKNATAWERDGRIHIGYFSGSPSHNRDFRLAAKAIADIMEDDPTVALRLVGFLQAPRELDRFSSRVERVELVDFVRLQAEIGATEINIVPLHVNAFTNGKSALKWFEAAIAGSLTVASPTNAYRAAIRHSENGWLATPATWADGLSAALRYVKADRMEVLEQARQDAAEWCSWRTQRRAITRALFEIW